MPDRICEACGQPFTAARNTRRTCSDACRQRLKRSNTGRDAAATVRVRSGGSVGDVEAVVFSQLEGHGQASSPRGAVALALARRIDCGIDTGSAIAACSRELRSLLDGLEAATPKYDIVDELRARHAARRSATQGLQAASDASLDRSAHTRK